MEKMKQIAQGAEAILYSNKKIVKKVRSKKNYRIDEIDSVLIKSRTKREVKVLEKLPVNHPKLIEEGNDYIIMEYIDGIVLKDAFDIKYCEEIGKMIAKIHDFDIIHGDLTTSNMILKDGKIYFIDFGLSFFSKKIEDKAVDLNLLHRAIESKHYQVFEQAFNLILKGYKISLNSKEVIKRLGIVQSRGRNKH